MGRGFWLSKHVRCQTNYLGKELEAYDRNFVYTCFEKQCGQILTLNEYFSQITLRMSTNVFNFQGSTKRGKCDLALRKFANG